MNSRQLATVLTIEDLAEYLKISKSTLYKLAQEVNALDFGALKANVTDTFDLRFALDMTTLDNGARYGINFLVADVGLVGVIGDDNHNGTVDAADYTVWKDTFSTSGPGLAADGNGDNAVTQADFTIWKNNFGAHSGSGAAAAAAAGVPEPSALLMLLTGILANGPRRRPAVPQIRSIVTRAVN